MSVAMFLNAQPENGLVLVQMTTLSIPDDSHYLKREGVLLSNTIPPGPVLTPNSTGFSDYNVPSGTQFQYVAGSIIDGQTQQFSALNVVTLNLTSAWLHHVAKGDSGNLGDLGALQLYNLDGQHQMRTREGNILRLAALEKPRIKTAPQVARTIEVPILIPNQDRATVMPILEAMLWSDDLFCFRDPFGEMMFCTIGDQETRTDINVEMTIKLVESAYSEAKV